jgi:hypothetical protein
MKQRLVLLTIILALIVPALAVARDPKLKVMERPVANIRSADEVSAFTQTGAPEPDVDFKRYDSYFERNDSGLKGETSYLVITNRAQFDAVFGGAATMSTTKDSFLPDRAFDGKIVVATIRRGDYVRKYDVTKVNASEGNLYVWYKVTDGKKGSATYYSPLILTVEKSNYSKIVFMEDGKKVAAVPVPANGDVFGYFFLTGKVHAEFKPIYVLSLDGSYGLSQTPPTYGRIRLKGRAHPDYVLSNVEITGNDLTFKTKAVRGISYEFTGTLTITDFKREPRSDETVLTGRLKKMMGGRVIAQDQVSFRWEKGD